MKHPLALLFTALAVLAGAHHATAQGTAFTYQGRLNAADTAVTGNYDFTFTLFSGSATNSGQVGGTLTNLNVGVAGGLFTVTLDFGANYPGASRWLGIGVRTNGGAGFTALTPLQPLTPTPYALYAPNAGSAATATGFSGTLVGNVTGTQGATVVATVGGQTAASVASGASAANAASSTNVANTLVKRDGSGNFAAGTVTATLAGNGGALTNLNASQLSNGVIPQSVLPGFQLASAYSTVGGGNSNTVSGAAATVAGGYLNGAAPDYATVGGGVDNLAGAVGALVAGGTTNAATGLQSSVGGGSWNWATNTLSTIAGGCSNLASGLGSTVAGGCLNGATTNYDTVGGGLGNFAYGPGSVIAGGVTNTATALEAAVGGGERNWASGVLSTISGGYNNLASGAGAVVGGGYGNLATNYAATVPGGYGNLAGGLYSFAAGAGALAVHDGAFVWADESVTNVMRSTLNNQFTARCAGGVRFFANPAATVGVQLAAGGNAWSPASDRNLKQNFKPVDARAVLAKLVATPVTEWNLISQDPAIRHLGPMAQDFKAAFGVGEDDRHISTTDADGVAFAAIQGLYQELKDRDARIATLEARLERLEHRLQQLNLPAPTFTSSSH